MITAGLVSVVGSAIAGGFGTLGYLASRRSRSRSRSAALALFGHGALATSALFLLVAVIHPHSLTAIHLHPLPQAFEQAFLCDFDWSCAAEVAALVAAGVLAATFLLSQVLSRLIVARVLRGGAHRAAIPGEKDVSLLVVPDPTPDAFSVSLVRLGGPRGLWVESFVVVTTALDHLLTPEESRVVREHELAHIRSRDSRYLPWFHVLASTMFFDPMLRALRRRIGRHYEFQADWDASCRTGSPRVLARALLKTYEASLPVHRNASLLGGGEACILAERIRRLLALAEAMEGSTAAVIGPQAT